MIKMKTAIYVALSFALPFYSCSTHKDMGQNQTREGHFRLYTYPEKEEKYFFEIENPQRYQEIIFTSFNDLEAKIYPNNYLVLDPAQDEKHEMKIGGISAYKAYLEILKQKFQDKLQIIGSGSLFSPKLDHQKTLFYLNYLGIDATGLSRTDFSLPFQGDYFEKLDQAMGAANFKVTLSNIFNLKTNSEYELKNIGKTAIVSTGNLKIGYISMVAPAMAQTLDRKKFNKVYFQPMAPKTITLANQLRKKGADIIVLMASHGIDCTTQLSQTKGIHEHKVNFMPNNEKICDLRSNELVDTLNKLPPGMVDIVFTNGVDSKVANLIAQHPVLQTFTGGEHLSWARLVYDTKFKRLIKNKTQIMQPIQLCHSFFKETQDCYVKEVLRNIEIVPAKFLGEEIEIQPLPIRK